MSIIMYGILFGTCISRIDQMINNSNPNISQYSNSLPSDFYKGMKFVNLDYLPYIHFENSSKHAVFNDKLFFKYFEL